LQFAQWANNTIRQLRHLIRPSDLEALVLTRRYWTLQSLVAMAGTVQINHLLNMEMDERKQALEDTIRELTAQIEHWSRPGAYVIPDTSVYVKHTEKLEDWGRLSFLDMRTNVPIHIVVPIIVVDELDRLKDSGTKFTRWRAGYSLAVLDRLLSPGERLGVLTAADILNVREEVSIEVVLDPPEHTRLPIADDEIVDRALAVQTLAGKSITLVTYDTGQSTRAGMAGLTVKKLDLPRDDEEPPRP
jgi:hypothetical protein